MIKLKNAVRPIATEQVVSGRGRCFSIKIKKRYLDSGVCREAHSNADPGSTACLWCEYFVRRAERTDVVCRNPRAPGEKP